MKHEFSDDVIGVFDSLLQLVSVRPAEEGAEYKFGMFMKAKKELDKAIENLHRPEPVEEDIDDAV